MTDSEFQSKDVPLKVSISSDHSCDISGRQPFKATIEVNRQDLSGDRRPLTLLKSGSIFDPSTAIAEGKIQLTDAETGALMAQPEQKEMITTPKQLSMDFEDSFITLFPKLDSKKAAVYTADLSFNLKNEDQTGGKSNNWGVQAGRWYIFQVPKGDLGVRWWNYGTREELLAPKGSRKTFTPSKPGMICSRSVAKTRFFADSNLPIPPPVSISFGLSSDIVHLSGTPPVSLQVSIALNGAKPITARSTVTDRPPRTILHKDFQLNCFSIIDAETREPVTISNPFIESPPGQGYPRNQFVTLQPGESLVRERVLATPTEKGPLNEARDITPSLKGHEFLMWLNSAEVWWTEQTKDELFGDQQRIYKLPYMPPIKLASDKEIRFRVED